MVVTLVAAMCFFVCLFFDLPGPTFFHYLFYFFLNIHEVHVLANLRKQFGLKQKKPCNFIYCYGFSACMCDFTFLCIELYRIRQYRIILTVVNCSEFWLP